MAELLGEQQLYDKFGPRKKMFFSLMLAIRVKGKFCIFSEVNHKKLYRTPWYVVYEGAAASHFLAELNYSAMTLG